MNVLNQTIVTNRNIVECGILNRRMTLEAFLHVDHPFHGTDFHFAIKVHIANIVRHEAIVDEYLTPVFRSTPTFFQNRNLCVC